MQLYMQDADFVSRESTKSIIVTRDYPFLKRKINDIAKYDILVKLIKKGVAQLWRNGTAIPMHLLLCHSIVVDASYGGDMSASSC